MQTFLIRFRRFITSRRLYYVLIPLMMLCLLTLAAQRWAIQWAVECIVASQGNKITFEETSGSFFHEFKAEKIVYEGVERDITMKGLVFHWNPFHLLYGKAAIDEISVTELSIDLKRSSTEPLKLPESLALPFSLSVEKIAIDSLSVKKLGMGPMLKNVHSALIAKDGQWHLNELGFDSAFGTVVMNASLQMEKPFALSGRIQVDNTDVDAHLVMDAKGTLDQMQLSGVLSGYGATGELKAEITPFESFIFNTLDLTASNINPSKFDETWPVAQFDIDTHIQTHSTHKVEGKLNIVNALPGAIEKNRLPIHRVQATIGGTVDSVNLSSLMIDLGQAGQFLGNAQFSEMKTAVDLKTKNFNLHGISETLRPTHAQGTVSYHCIENKQEIVTDLKENHIQLKADILKTDDLLALKEGLLIANSGKLSMSGHMNMTDNQDFVLKGNIRHFNFAALGKLPPSNLNLILGVSGALKPEWKADVYFSFDPSTLFNQPVSGQGKIQIRGKAITDATINLALGLNKFTASGRLGELESQINWALNAPALGHIGYGIEGALSGSGTLSGPLDAMQGKIALTGQNFKVKDLIGAQDLRINAEFGTTRSSKINTHITAKQATLAGTHWTLLDFKTSGTWHSHILEAEAKSSHYHLTAQISGGITAAGGWLGTLQHLENRGKKPFTLVGAASLKITSSDIFSVENLRLNIGEGQLTVKRFIKKYTHLETDGNASHIPLNWLLSLSQTTDATIDSSLTMGGEWSVRADHAVNGALHFYREDGDITLIGEENRFRFRLTGLDANAQFNNNNMNVRLKASSRRLGETDVLFKSRLSRRQGSWGLFKDSPIQLSIKSDMPSIGWLNFLTGQPDMDISGSLMAHVNGSGTLGMPKLAGSIGLHDIGIDWPSAGIHLDRGEVIASLNGNRLMVTKGNLYGEEGQLKVSGGAIIQNGALNSQIKLQADHLMVLSNVERKVVLSGNAEIGLDDQGVNLLGHIRIDRAKVVLSNLTGVTRSKDVTVLGRPLKKKNVSPFRFRVTADLGHNFILQGMGVETYLVGQLTAESLAGGQLQLRGNINTENGVFNAYGQKLVIKQARATFTGAPDNPMIDVLAVKEFSSSDEVKEVGVRVRGTAQMPKIKLYSDPEIPDSEKLSWLVVGYGGGENGSAQQRAALATATSAILGATNVGGIPNRLAGALGVDVGLSSSSQVDDTVLALSYRIASNLFLSYEQGLAGAISVIKLRYQLSRRMSVVGQTGTITAFDMLYDWRFD